MVLYVVLCAIGNHYKLVMSSAVGDSEAGLCARCMEAKTLANFDHGNKAELSPILDHGNKAELSPNRWQELSPIMMYMLTTFSW